MKCFPLRILISKVFRKKEKNKCNDPLRNEILNPIKFENVSKYATPPPNEELHGEIPQELSDYEIDNKVTKKVSFADLHSIHEQTIISEITETTIDTSVIETVRQEPMVDTETNDKLDTEKIIPIGPPPNDIITPETYVFPTQEVSEGVANIELEPEIPVSTISTELVSVEPVKHPKIRRKKTRGDPIKETKKTTNEFDDVVTKGSLLDQVYGSERNSLKEAPEHPSLRRRKTLIEFEEDTLFRRGSLLDKAYSSELQRSFSSSSRNSNSKSKRKKQTKTESETNSLKRTSTIQGRKSDADDIPLGLIRRKTLPKKCDDSDDDIPLADVLVRNVQKKLAGSSVP